ncbi:MAG TPA: uracil-DNA glycosylase family protein [Chitinophagaceae bacterium]
MNFAEHILDFLFHLSFPVKTAPGIGVLDVHRDPEVQKACTAFYRKFYNDRRKRRMLIGINPGRFGGGVTGIPFTDPVRLERDCGIENPWPKKQELSSVFMYAMMAAYGGVVPFYRDVYITAVSPLGFVRDGKNLNYYDDRDLKEKIRPFVVDCMEKQLAFGIHRDACFCIGAGENLKFFTALNREHGWFKTVEAVAHPRFVMQYRLKSRDEYIGQYISVIKKYAGV